VSRRPDPRVEHSSSGDSGIPVRFTQTYPAAGEPFELVERPVLDLAPDEVRIVVEACGICHSDAYVREETDPGIEYPRVPGQEIAGRIDAVGVRTSNTGSRAAAWALAGTAATASPARPVGVATSRAVNGSR
jgi:NADPH:quinone reductase-like Zn-dependent oxidoreductase